MKQYRAKSTYFLTEGKANLQECLKLSFDHAVRSGTRKIVVFTGNGDGLEMACNKYLNQQAFQPIQLIGVSLPFGSAPQQALHISETRQQLFEQFKIPVVRAAFPLDDLTASGKARSLVHRALEFFGGGMALCINAVLIACDAGFVDPGEHVIAMSADTSILVKASPSTKVFAALAVREIICKSLIQDITKGEALAVEVNLDALLKPRKAKPKALPSATQSSRRQIEE